MINAIAAVVSRTRARRPFRANVYRFDGYLAIALGPMLGCSVIEGDYVEIHIVEAAR